MIRRKALLAVALLVSSFTNMMHVHAGWTIFSVMNPNDELVSLKQVVAKDTKDFWGIDEEGNLYHGSETEKEKKTFDANTGKEKTTKEKIFSWVVKVDRYLDKIFLSSKDNSLYGLGKRENILYKWNNESEKLETILSNKDNTSSLRKLSSISLFDKDIIVGTTNTGEAVKFDRTTTSELTTKVESTIAQPKTPPGLNKLVKGTLIRIKSLRNNKYYSVKKLKGKWRLVADVENKSDKTIVLKIDRDEANPASIALKSDVASGRYLIESESLRVYFAKKKKGAKDSHVLWTVHGPSLNNCHMQGSNKKGFLFNTNESWSGLPENTAWTKARVSKKSKVVLPTHPWTTVSIEIIPPDVSPS